MILLLKNRETLRFIEKYLDATPMISYLKQVNGKISRI